MTESYSEDKTGAEFFFDLIDQNSFAHEMTWSIVEPSKLARATTSQGIYTLEVRPDRKSYTLSFNGCVCPTRFTAINRAQWEADDHYRRLLAQRQQPARMKPPKW